MQDHNNHVSVDAVRPKELVELTPRIMKCLRRNLTRAIRRSAKDNQVVLLTVSGRIVNVLV